MIYLAYGMNMDPEIIKKRMPDAKVLGTGVIKNHTLIFCNCVDISPSEGKVVPVVVMEVSENDEKIMDKYENYPDWYDKQEFMVYDFKPLDECDGCNGCDEKWRGRKRVRGVAYVMRTFHSVTRQVNGDYIQKIKNGYEHFGLDESILDEILEDYIVE